MLPTTIHQIEGSNCRKRPKFATRQDAIVFHHDNVRRHASKPVKKLKALKPRSCPFRLQCVLVDAELPH